MNNKQTILKILDKHRDMSLTMGCEVVYHHNDGVENEDQKCLVTWIRNPVKNGEDSNSKLTLSGIGDCRADEEEIEILGRPATPLTLLKALNGINEKVAIWSTWGDGMFISCGVNKIQIPDVTTLTELPHTHQLWTDLLPILS